MGISGFAEKKKKPEINLEARKQTVETRIEQIRYGSINGVTFLGEEIDFWSEFLKRLIKTGNLIGVSRNGRMLGGFEVSFYEGSSIDGICGVIPEEDKTTTWFWGAEYKGFPLLGDFTDIFKRFDPGVIIENGKLRFTLSFEFREEEIQKRTVE